jgi:hypothetical protein
LRTNKTQPRQFFSVTFAYFRLGSNLRRCKTYGALSDPILYDKFSWNSFLLRRKNFRSERSNQANQSTVLWQQKKKKKKKKTHVLVQDPPRSAAWQRAANGGSPNDPPLGPARKGGS